MHRTLSLIIFALLALNLRGEDAQFSITLVHDGEPLEHAVASLTPLDFPVPSKTAAEAVIAQEDREYNPYVTVVMAGTAASFPNRDDVQHHLYSVSKPKRFEKPLYGSGTSETVLFDKPGVVTLGCNIHDWMVAYVLVVTTPWFATSGPDGLAEINGLPTGRYELEVWHPRIRKPIKQEITLVEGANSAEKIRLNLKRDRRIRRAPTGRSGGY